MSGGNIKVVVRCRPLNNRELSRGAKGLIRMEGDQTILEPPQSDDNHASSKAIGKRPQIFSFDKSYWSAGPRDEPQYASQQTLYDDLGVELLDHSFEGFNTCIFAYGQTGSGKSYSMMGYGADRGIIPLTTSELFQRVSSRSAADPNLSYTVEVSYIEIYNEKVRDLLNPKNKDNLRVREHPSLGPYVEDLSRLVVEDDQQMMTLMDEGNKARTVASTNMNETSSRSHAVFTVILTQKRLDPQTKMTGEKVSKISLVDLAGSERQASTGATGTRLREGANINRSLTTLGKVIAALAQASNEPVKGRKKKDEFVPYRDSILTWLLKESLGGNSKTAMIAAISPADYEETLSTLRYADAAKKIKTHAVVNEDPNAKLIRELKEELELLRSRVTPDLSNGESVYDPSVPPEQQIVTYRTKDGEIKKVSKAELQDQLQASEKLMESLNLTWEEKMAKTAAIHVEREKALEELGISIDKHVVGVHAPQKHPSLVNLNDDPLMSECLVYQLKPGTTIAGALGGEVAHIRLSGAHILDTHCIFNNADGTVTVEALPDARTFVNGKRVPPNEPVKLLNGFRVILGDFHVFRFNDPEAVRLERQRLNGNASSPGTRPDSPSKISEEFMDWSAARREVANIEKLGDQDLDRLYDDIVKVRTLRGRPDSRVDLATEVDSRLMTPSQNDEPYESALNPWAGPLETTLTTDSVQTPFAQDQEGVAPVDLDATDVRSDSSAIETLGPAIQLQLKSATQAQDTSLEHEHLTRQLKTLAQEVKRVRSQAAAARALGRDVLEPETWSSSQLRLARMAITRWKKMQTFKMAEQILVGAVELREANIIAHELGRQVLYNFLVGDDGAGLSKSAVGAVGAVIELEDVGETLSPTSGPGVLIKVIDREANAVYAWDHARFRQQLNTMRHVRALKAKPNYAMHFRNEGTFSDISPPSYSLVGSTRMPLRLLAFGISHDAVVPIICPYTMEAIGSCRLVISHPSSGSSGIDTPESSSRPLASTTLAVGQKHSFTIAITTVRGLSTDHLTAMHLQVRLSSLVGNDIASDDMFLSPVIDLAKSSVTQLALKRTINIMVTADMVRHMQTSYATVDFFAKLRPSYLDRLERWDVTRELSPPSTATHTPPESSTGSSRPPMRRCETEFLGHEHHDILAKVAIQELSANGTYEPVDLVHDIYHLHQGVQRRLSITLRHASGQRLSWRAIEHVATGDIRIREKGQTTVSTSEVTVAVTSLQPDYLSDGTSTLSATGPWDSGSHGSIHLDRRTPADQTVIVRLVFLVNVESLQEPASFSLDLPIRVLARDSRRRSSLMSYFAADRTHDSLTAIYSVELSPPLAQSSQDLWKLDTANKHVKGEEQLGDWRPRSVSLVEDWATARKTATSIADKQCTLAVLDLLQDVDDRHRAVSEEKGQGLLRRCVDLWQKHMDERVKVDLHRQSPEEEILSKKLRKLLPDLETKLVPHVKLQPRVETVIKAGTMMILRDSQANRWDKAHFVLRRPYLHVHPAPSEREDQIINLSKANVVPSPDVEALLGRRFAFTIFTPTNSHVLQAANAKELAEWMRVIITSAG